MSKSCLFKTLRLWGLFLMTLPPIICGCVPAFYTYWIPDAPGGKLFNDINRIGGIAPSDSIEFSFTDVRIQFTGNGTMVSITLLIPRGRSASFASNKIKLHEDDYTVREIAFSVNHWDHDVKPMELNPTNVMIGRDIYAKLLGGAQPDTFVADIEFGGGERAHYSIEVPAIKIADHVFGIPIIEFTKKEGFGIGPIM